MDEDALKRLFVIALAQEAVLHALIASHPEPRYLQKLLRGLSEPGMVTLLGFHWEDKYPDQFSAKIAKFLKTSEKYQQTTDPNSSPAS